MARHGYLYDPFQAMALGGGTPPGWSFNGGGGTVYAYSGGTGGIWSPHNWYSFASQDLYCANLGDSASYLTFWFAMKSAGGRAGQWFNVYSEPISGDPHSVAVFNLRMEPDQSITALVGGSGSGTVLGNTGLLGFSYPMTNYEWRYFQINLLIGYSGVAPYYLKITADLAIDSQIIFQNQSGLSNFFTKNSVVLNSSNQPTFQDVSWSQLIGAGAFGLGETIIGDPGIPAMLNYPNGLWNIVVTNGGSGYSSSPSISISTSGSNGEAFAVAVVVSGVITAINIVSQGLDFSSVPSVTITDSTGTGAMAVAQLTPNPFVRVPQAVLEVATKPNTAKVRIPQQALEVATLPTSPFIRIPQSVIELMYVTSNPPPPPPGGVAGPEYIKRRAIAN